MTKNQDPLEEGCFAMTFERKYYHRDECFIKRRLRPREFRTGYRGLYIPRFRKESLMNEAASLRYIRQHTNIPVPTVYCDFEDDDAYYLVTSYVEGASMSSLPEHQKVVVQQELEVHLATLKTLKSNRLGGPSGILIPPYRVLRRTENDHWNPGSSDHDEFVFCHNDLSQQNVIVDPKTLQIKAIIDWEYAGFFPARFEWPFYTRLGPSIAKEEEYDDSLELLEFLKSKIDETRIEDPGI